MRHGEELVPDTEQCPQEARQMQRDGSWAPYTGLRPAGGTLDWSESALHRTVTAQTLWQDVRLNASHLMPQRCTLMCAWILWCASASFE